VRPNGHESSATSHRLTDEMILDAERLIDFISFGVRGLIGPSK
jgi:hypothetical protein